MSKPPPSPAEDSSNLRSLLNAKTRAFFQHPDRSEAQKAAVMTTVFDCMADGLIVLDENKTIILANAAAAELAGWDVDDLKDLTRDKLRENFHFFYDQGKTPIPPEDEAIFVAMRTKEPYESEGFITGTSLPTEGVWTRAKAAPIFNEEGDAVGGVTVFHDITERRRLERQRNCLTALIVHDIKNHLAANTVLLDLLQGLFGEHFDGEIIELFHDLKRSNAWFFEIANSLLEMSRAQFFTKKSYGQPVSLEPLLQSVVELNRATALSEGVSLKLTAAANLPEVCAIPAVLLQVFHNVIQNAIAASHPGSTVEVSLGEIPATGRLEVKVADHGRGMSPEDVAALFDTEYVASHLPKTTRSTGFGLYLSAMLLEAQDGTISCTSALGEGTEIVMSLPVGQCPPTGP